MPIYWTVKHQIYIAGKFLRKHSAQVCRTDRKDAGFESRDVGY